MARVYLEFYCTLSGDGCGGFITFPLNTGLNGVIEVVCPNCGHEHRRRVKNGEITAEGRYCGGTEGRVIEHICPTEAAWHKKPQSSESKRRAESGLREREAVVIERDATGRAVDPRSYLSERRFEIFGGK